MATPKRATITRQIYEFIAAQVRLAASYVPLRLPSTATALKLTFYVMVPNAVASVMWPRYYLGLFMNTFAIDRWHCFLIRLGGCFAGYYTYSMYLASSSPSLVERRKQAQQALFVMGAAGLASLHYYYSNAWDYSYRYGLVFYGTGISSAALATALLTDTASAAGDTLTRRL